MLSMPAEGLGATHDKRIAIDRPAFLLSARFCLHTDDAAGYLHSTLLCLVVKDIPSAFQPLLAGYPKLPTLPASSNMLHSQTVKFRHS